MLLAAGAQAKTITVATDGSGNYTSIQAAIDAASGAGDTILVAAGTYRESLFWSNKSILLRGAGVGRSIIDPSAANGGPGGCCLHTLSVPSDARIEGFTFQNGNADNGGGMYNY